MILEIKRKKKEKRIQIVGALLGICVAGGATFFGVSQVMEARQEAKEAEVQEEIERQ